MQNFKVQFVQIFKVSFILESWLLYNRLCWHDYLLTTVAGLSTDPELLGLAKLRNPMKISKYVHIDFYK